MLIIKYRKTYPASLISHTDTVRTVTHIFRRAKVDAEYSKGFNPHMELYFSPALPVGVESVCEFLAVKAAYEENLTERLNAVSPAGFVFTRLYEADVNLAADVTAAKYLVECRGLGTFCEEVVQEGSEIEYEEKGVSVKKDVSDKIFALEKKNADIFYVTLACGNNNLRCDRLVTCLMRKHGVTADYRTQKTEMYVGEETVDEYLRRKGGLLPPQTEK